MTRKSKQPGGHNPLTYHETKRLKSSDYGTTTARLGTESQQTFGDCCLGLGPAVDPVATPSGHVYSREAIVKYLLSKNRELKEQRAKYEAHLAAESQSAQDATRAAKLKSVDDFVKKDQGATRASASQHSETFDKMLGKKISTETEKEGRDTLKRTSYWLSEFQPEHKGKHGGDERGSAGVMRPPPERPPSPMSGNPLRLKELIPLDLKREGQGSGTTGKCMCAVSGNALTTQAIVAIKKTGQVMLRDVYENLAKPSMTCPVTGRKFKEKDVIELQKAASGFAASGEVVAKRYRPTLT